ncbi:MAG: glutamate-5-semialdehyde dehydrogenase [Chloroflexi bacterium]|nr:glutamate-5-semialdehyde dehydrogenase [Chloroflexota bacterium]|tara:strand:+ start:175 stop:1431 length:1257 start_codon:yes stop_codon:yes gene_type:complete
MLEKLEKKLIEVKKFSSDLSLIDSEKRKLCLSILSSKLISNSAKIIEINSNELKNASINGIENHVIERMKITDSTISRMVDSLENVSNLDDTVLEVIDSNIRDNGLVVKKVRVPLGVLGVIFESRPNVVIEIASLAIKSGNGLVMRGGSDCIKTNLALFELVSESMKEAGLPEKSMYFLDFTDRKAVDIILSMDKYIDLLIPRGSSSLVNLVNQKAKMPSITGGVGVCHTFIDSKIDTKLALSVLDNAKTQNTSVCNALDTIIIHNESLDIINPLFNLFLEKKVEIRADKYSYEKFNEKSKIKLASKSDFGEEFLDLIVSIKTVKNIDEAISHIEKFGSKHSEAIITNDEKQAKYFLDRVDASAVFHNTSTRFNDGFELGLGAEVAVSTDKLHARGPMGINDLMTYKWVVTGEGQLRS